MLPLSMMILKPPAVFFSFFLCALAVKRLCSRVRSLCFAGCGLWRIVASGWGGGVWVCIVGAAAEVTVASAAVVVLFSIVSLVLQP